VLIILFMRGSHSTYRQDRCWLLSYYCYQACLSTVFPDPPYETAISKSDRGV